MSVNYLHKKSNTASKRPTAASLDIGELALNYESGTPGVFFEDSSGLVRKVGPVEVSGTAPNASPAGSSGNSIGEQWLDTSVTPSVLKTWSGSAWVEAGGQATTLDGPVTFTAQANGALVLGDVVYISGAAGDVPIVTKAQANSATTMPAYGFVGEDISSGSTGKIITFGSVEGSGADPLDTSGLTVNDVVYVSATVAGGWTTTKPTGEANLIQNIGRVQRVNSSNGVIKVGGAGRASATPNLNDGNIFVGNASNEATTDAFTDVLAAQSGITTNATDLTVDRHILPDTNITYDLGSATQRFRDIYLSNNTINMGGTTLSVDTETGTLAVGGEDLVKASDPVVTGDVNMSDNAELHLYELTSNGTDYIGMRAPESLTTTTTFTWPDGDGTTQQVLQTNGSGTLSWASVTTAASPIFSGNPTLTNAGEFRWQEATVNGTDYIGFKAPDSVTTSTTFTWPDGDGSANQLMVTDGSGNLSWVDFDPVGLATTATGTVLTLSDTLITATQPIGLDNQSALRYYELDANGSNYIAFQAPASVTADVTFTLPDGDGTSGQVLSTNGSGTLSWVTQSGGGSGTTGLDTTATGTVMTLSDTLITATQPIGLDNQKALRYYELDSNGSNYVAFQAPASVTADVTLTLPDGDGSADQVLKTDGSGNLSWTTNIINSAGIADTATGAVLTLSDTAISGGTVDADFGDSTLNIDASDGLVGINTTAPASALSVFGYNDANVLSLNRFEDSYLPPIQSFNKGRGTNLSFSQLAANDLLGLTQYFGYNGTALAEGAQSYVQTLDTSMNTCEWIWKTSVSGTLDTRMALISTGELQVGTGVIVNNGKGVKFNEASANGTNYVELKAPASLSADASLTLPAEDGDAGQVMTTDGSGNLGFTTFGIGAHASFDASAGAGFSWSSDEIASGNVSGVTRTETGKFTISFTNSFASTAYTVVCTAGDQDYSGTGASPRAVNVVSRFANSVDIVVERTDDAAQDDCGYIAIMVIGALA